MVVGGQVGDDFADAVAVAAVAVLGAALDWAVVLQILVAQVAHQQAAVPEVIVMLMVL